MKPTAFFLPILALSEREVVRFYRVKSRVIGALVPPIIFWLLLGLGLGKSFSLSNAPETSAIQYFFPGTILLIALFTSIFSTISTIEDRREGFLQSVIVAPVDPLAISLGKILGGTILGFSQGVILIAVAVLARFLPFSANLIPALLGLFFSCLALTAMGFVFAWKMDSTQGFHAVMNIVLMPMWFLSGALFPEENANVVLRWAMKLNPMAYCLGILRGAFDPRFHELQLFPSTTLAWSGVMIFCLAAIAAAGWVCSGE